MPKETLSASKIKVLQSCSWLYWCKYVLRLPDTTNSGAQKGEIVHLVFEYLGNPRHRKHFDKILKSPKGVNASRSVKKLISKHIAKKNLTKEDYKDVCDMVQKGLLIDFWGEKYGKPSQVLSEKSFEFEICEKDVCYKIKGFIDKLFIYKDRGLILIRDFKTNKKKYDGKEVTDNLQDNIYTLAIKKLYPEYSDIQMEFLFLKQEKEEDITLSMAAKSRHEISGFEYELTEYQKYADSFNQKLALSNLAANQKFPTDGSFCGPLLCGFAKYPGQKKKDGTLMWHCPFKFGFECFFLLNEDGKIAKSSFNKQDLEKILKKGQKIVHRRYKGCPRFNNIVG